ncbi:hypothetical protein, variant [Sphaeroforma arctica JP610]|nr:hypothetical protein, variant [Sphaeroforma arctica JP610]KNC76371.1 hypothetical protein, variant [Sphaeroforma arctica JP610]|eukprot:XP_014150273.1 hypothetical protein, variant [Sphaeroforma arctica JP610]
MYAPSSGIWWATYGFVQDKLNNRVLTCEEDRQTYRVPVQAFCGMSAGMTAATLTNPLDVIKTRIQTSSKKLTVATAVRQLISTEGVMGFSNGMTAKVMNSAPVSVLMISVYDLVKRLSVKAVPHFHVEGEPHKIVMLTKKEDGWTAGDGRKIKEKEDKK